MEKININDFTIYGCGTFDECNAEFDVQFHDFFDTHESMDDLFCRDDLYMQLFIDYVPEFMFEPETYERIDCEYPFIFVARDDMTEMHYIWLNLDDKQLHTRALYISDGKYGYTVNKCVDDDFNHKFDHDVFDYISLLHMDMCTYYGI